MINLDKILHFCVGFLITFSISPVNSLLGLFTGVLAGTLKEFYDYKHKDKHTPDGLDLISTISGSMLAFIIYFILEDYI